MRQRRSTRIVLVGTGTIYWMPAGTIMPRFYTNDELCWQTYFLAGLRNLPGRSWLISQNGSTNQIQGRSTSRDTQPKKLVSHYLYGFTRTELSYTDKPANNAVPNAHQEPQPRASGSNGMPRYERPANAPRTPTFDPTPHYQHPNRASGTPPRAPDLPYRHPSHARHFRRSPSYQAPGPSGVSHDYRAEEYAGGGDGKGGEIDQLDDGYADLAPEDQETYYRCDEETFKDDWGVLLSRFSNTVYACLLSFMLLLLTYSFYAQISSRPNYFARILLFLFFFLYHFLSHFLIVYSRCLHVTLRYSNVNNCDLFIYLSSTWGPDLKVFEWVWK